MGYAVEKLPRFVRFVPTRIIPMTLRGIGVYGEGSTGSDFGICGTPGFRMNRRLLMLSVQRSTNDDMSRTEVSERARPGMATAFRECCTVIE